MERECSTCMYYNEKEEINIQGAGECISEPPRIVVIKDKPGSYYPVVSKDYVCRFYTPRTINDPVKARSKGQARPALAPELTE